MTNSNHNQPTHISQSAPARAWADTWRFLSTRPFWLIELLVPMLVGLAVLVLSVPQVMAIIFPAAALATIPLLASSFFLLTAPLKQRNEARKELAAVREKLSPRLRVVGVNKSFDNDDNLANALIDVEYVRLVVANQSDTIATNCAASLLDMRPKDRFTPAILTGATYQALHYFPGYNEIPYPVSLAWSDSSADDNAKSRSIFPQGKAQVDLLNYSSVEGLFVAFASRQQRRQFKLPKVGVVCSVRFDSDNCLPYFCVVRYLPNTSASGPIKALEILHESSQPPNLDNFRVGVPTNES